jgi:hypothetical protein
MKTSALRRSLTSRTFASERSCTILITFRCLFGIIWFGGHKIFLMLSNESLAPNQSASSRPSVSPMRAAMVWNNTNNRGCCRQTASNNSLEWLGFCCSGLKKKFVSFAKRRFGKKLYIPLGIHLEQSGLGAIKYFECCQMKVWPPINRLYLGRLSAICDV